LLYRIPAPGHLDQCPAWRSISAAGLAKSILHGPVAFAILPIFAFANAGLSLTDMSLNDLAHPVTMGVVSGLLIGKPLGILFFVGLAVSLRFAQLPKNVSWLQITAVSFACGIGFTMSLFIAGLAFESFYRRACL
jgi:NhaA family Na+:H+ antiporter